MSKFKRDVAVVAIGEHDSAVLWCLPGGQVEEDQREHGLGPADIWGGDVPIEPGLWVWEGMSRVVKLDTPYGYDYDVEYTGHWRRPDNIEWAFIREGKSPLLDKVTAQLTQPGVPTPDGRLYPVIVEAIPSSVTSCPHCTTELKEQKGRYDSYTGQPVGRPMRTCPECKRQYVAAVPVLIKGKVS